MLIIEETGCEVVNNSLQCLCNFSVSLNYSKMKDILKKRKKELPQMTRLEISGTTFYLSAFSELRKSLLSFLEISV